jgi:hypothetical protein
MPDPHPADDGPLPEYGRFASLELEARSLVLYDREDHRAWLQSDRAVSLAAHV